MPGCGVAGNERASQLGDIIVTSSYCVSFSLFPQRAVRVNSGLRSFDGRMGVKPYIERRCPRSGVASPPWAASWASSPSSSTPCSCEGSGKGGRWRGRTGRSGLMRPHSSRMRLLLRGRRAGRRGRDRGRDRDRGAGGCTRSRRPRGPGREMPPRKISGAAAGEGTPTWSRTSGGGREARPST